jgi:hypothetical protein
MTSSWSEPQLLTIDAKAATVSGVRAARPEFFAGRRHHAQRRGVQTPDAVAYRQPRQLYDVK